MIFRIPSSYGTTLSALIAACTMANAATAGDKEIRLQHTDQVNSLQSVLDVISGQRAGSDALSPVTVTIEDGVYLFDKPLTLEPEHSNIRFEAKSGARPVFVGGRRITNWQVDSHGVWTTRVDPSWRFEALWVNGQRATRARTPNKGYIQAMGQPTEPISGIPLAGPVAKTLISVTPDDAALLGVLSPEEQKEVQVQVYHSWDVSRLRLAGVSATEGKLQFTGGVRDFFNLEPWHRLRFENYLGAMDEPGEWFLEGNGTLHYIPLPGETPETATVFAPVAQQWVVFKGRPEKGQCVENVAFNGLKFEYQQWQTPPTGMHAGQAESHLPSPAVEATGVRNLRFLNCVFAHTMTHAVWLREGCSDVNFEHCYFHDLGAGGIYVGDPSIKVDGPRHTHHVTVNNCILRGGGRYFPAGIGISLFHASDSVIRHCDIGDFFYSSISIGWTWGYQPTVAGRNLVEFCHLHHLGWSELSDMGAVYTLGQQLGTVIRNNHIHDIGCASYGAWGMYNDEGSTGVLWENNLVHDTQSAGYHQHYGRGNLVRNNILAWGKEEQLRRSRSEEALAFAFERNIVLMGDGKLFMHLDKTWNDGRVFLADNVYWHAKGAPQDFAGKSWAEWQALGNDVRSVLADPQFKDPAHGDWSLAADSPALKLGFQPFDWKTAGVTGDDSWKALASAPLPPMVYGTKPKPVELRMKEGFEGFAAEKRVTIGRKNKNIPALFAVADIPGANGKCLELRDGPDQQPTFEPHFFFDPAHTQGTTHVEFDLRTEPEYRLNHEWRDGSTPYVSSVSFTVEGGVVKSGNRKLAEFPPLTWVHFEVDSAVGENSDGTWTLTVTPAGGVAQRVEGLKPAKGSLKEVHWLGFSSPGTAPAKAWLDNLAIDNR